MRPNHNNKRMRGRPQNNRRGPNPLTRSYESNGPDVKIRGNAHHVAEKYLQLARDAHTGGDPIAAENYLQHAEHYFRLIASAQAAQALAQSGRPPAEGEGDDGEDDDDFGGLSDRFASPLERQAPPPQVQPPQPGFAPANGAAGAPVAPTQPNYDARPDNREGYQQRDNFQPRNNNYRNDRNQQRPDRQGGQDYRNNRDQKPREFRIFREYEPRNEPVQQPEVEAPGLPSFITAAPRAPTASETTDYNAAETNQPAVQADTAEPHEEAATEEFNEGGAPQPRGRRRRLRSPYGLIRGTNESDEGPTGQE
jgi:Domain of unknown function (DUF4167)